MSILSSTGKILLVREPACGRFGIHKLMAMISSGSIGVKWNGLDEISVITFNRKRSICKVLKYEISYFKSLQIVLRLLKVTTVISSIPFHLTPSEFEEIMANSLCIPKRPQTGSRTI